MTLPDGTMAVRNRGSFDTSVASRALRPSARLRAQDCGGKDGQAGEGVHGDLADALRRDAVVEGGEAQRAEDVLAQHAADVAPRHPADDLAEDEAAGEGVVGEAAAGHAQRLRVAEDGEQALRIGEQPDVDLGVGDGRDAGAVGEELAEGDVLLAVLAELGEVLDDGVVEVQGAALVELVDDHGGHGLRRGEEVEEGVVAGGHARRVLRVARGVAAKVSDGAVEDDHAAAAHAERERRLEARLVELHRGVPDRLDGLRLEPRRARLHLGVGVAARHLSRREDPHVHREAALHVPSRSLSRSLNLSTLPVAFVGSASTRTTRRGTL